MNNQYYSDSEVAALLGISLSRLRGKVCQGEPLPARIKVPGTRTRLWLKEDVHNWLRQFREEDSKTTGGSQIRKVKR